MNLSFKLKNRIYKAYNLLQRIKKICTLFFLSDEYIFTKFYKKNKWGASESKSGQGSSKKNTLSIKNNNLKFSDRRKKFIKFDIVKNIPPTVDLIFCRDAFIHLSNSAILKVLNNFQKSGSRLLLTTHFPNEKKNIFIVNGMFRRINLEINPFNFPPPIKIILEDKIEGSTERKCLALWDLKTLTN